MTENKKVKTVVVCAMALSGCAGTPPAPTTATASTRDPGSERKADPAKAKANGAEAVLHVDENLSRLRAIGVFTVGQLVVAYPAGSTNCYGPCPGQEPVVKAAEEKAALALAAFADRVESAVKTPPAGPCDASIEANLAALGALKIVDVQGFAKTTPQTRGNCYNQPCPDDLAAAKAADAVNACKLEAIVRATKG